MEQQERHVALLRGINVGGKHKLSMHDLVALFAAAGAESSRTYIQSGNVVFRASDPATLCATVEQRIVERFGFESPIVFRTGAELGEVIARNPFLPDEIGRAHV